MWTWKKVNSTFTEGATQTAIGFGFRGENQIPLFMLWREYRDKEENVVFAEVLFSTCKEVIWGQMKRSLQAMLKRLLP